MMGYSSDSLFSTLNMYDKKLVEFYYDNLNIQTLRCKFIRFYEVIEGNLVIHLYNEKIITPYNKELELAILDKMKSQVLYYDKKVKNYLESHKSNFNLSILYLFTSFSQFLLFTINHFWLTAVGGACWLICASTKGLPLSKSYIKSVDIKKHTLFLKNEDEINNLIIENMLKCGILNEDAINLVPKFTSYATINDVHFMSKKDVQDLVNGNISEDMIYKLKKDR